MPVEWGNLAPGANIFANFKEGEEAGRKVRSDREVKMAANLFASDPEAGARAMIAAGRPDLAASSFTANNGMRTERARNNARPSLAAGDWRGASRAAMADDPNLGAAYGKQGDDEQDRAYKLGTRGAQVLMAASQLETPEERRRFIDTNAQDLVGFGLPPEKIAAYDVTNPQRMRADAARFMELSQIAPKTSVEKFGDNAVTYETSPVTGTRAVGRTTIPPTRKELQDAAEFQYRKDHDGKELSLREKEFQLRQFIASNPDSSPAKVVGPIFRKLSNGQPLTAGEQEALRYYKLDPITAGAMGGDDGGGDEELGGSPPPSRRPPGGGAPGAAAATPPASAFANVRDGQTVTFANGQTWAMRSGKPVRVK